MDYQILNLLFRCNKEFSHEKIRKQELSDTECMICSYIYSHENCSQDDVSVALKTDKTTVGKALMSLAVVILMLWLKIRKTDFSVSEAGTAAHTNAF